MPSISKVRHTLYQHVVETLADELNALLGMKWTLKQWEVCIGLLVLRVTDSVLFERRKRKLDVDSVNELSSLDFSGLTILRTSDVFAAMTYGIKHLHEQLTHQTTSESFSMKLLAKARPIQRVVNYAKRQETLNLELSLPLSREISLNCLGSSPISLVTDFTIRDLMLMTDVEQVGSVTVRYKSGSLNDLCVFLVLSVLPIPFRSRSALMNFDFGNTFGWKDSIERVTTAVGQASNDALKIFVARNRASIHFTILQHGVNYGSDSTGQLTWLDTKIPDSFVSWGWKDSPNVIRGHLHRSAPVKLTPKAARRNDVLLVLPPWSPQFRHYDTKLEFLEQMREVRHFLSVVHPTIRVHVRPYKAQNAVVRESYLALQRDFPGMLISRTSSFERESSRYKLVVFGYLSTGFLERLADNLPTLIIDPRLYRSKTRRARPLFRNLEEVGAAFTSGMDAGLLAKETISRAEVSEWFDIVSQSDAYMNFKSEYARTMPGSRD